MKWNPASASLSLEAHDLKVMMECAMPFTEVVRPTGQNRNIPPLWSVLSYCMLEYDEDKDNMWFRYRYLKELAQFRDCWYYDHWIPKANGELRKLSVPLPAMRAQQRFILRTILAGLKVDEHACAYRKGMGAEHCAQPHVNRRVLVHLDIRNFFGSITENMVYQTFVEQTGYSKSLCRFLARICCLRGSLPQGTVTSPALSNIVFRPCDEALADLAQRWDMRYSRYCDDLFFSSDKDRKVDGFLKEAREILFRHGFFLNPDKTKVRRRQHCQTVLGLTVNERVQVNRQYRRKLLQELYYLERFGPNCDGAVNSGSYLGYMRVLQGRLAYVLQMDPDNGKLRDAQAKLALRIKQHQFLLERGFL